MYIAYQAHQYHEGSRCAVCRCGGAHRTVTAAARCAGVRRLEDASQYGYRVGRIEERGATWAAVARLTPEEDYLCWQ